MQYLAICEVDQRQNFILRVDKLREMLGASALIRDTVAVAKANLGQGVQLIWPVSGVLWFTSGDLSELAKTLGKVRAEFLNKGLSATFAVGTYSSDDFTNSLKALERRIRRLKDTKSGEDGSPRSPLFAQCGIQGRLPANRWHPHQVDSRRRLLSDDSAIRLAQAQRYDEEIVQHFDPQQRYRKLRDLDDLVYSRSDSYTALCKADCDGVGRLLPRIDWGAFAERLGLFPEEAAEMFAASLKDAVQAALDVTIKKIVEADCHQGGCFPILPLVVAGDDLWILVRRDLAFRLAIDLSREFASAAKDQEVLKMAVEMFQPSNPLTLSFGLLFAKKGFPFDAQIDLAEELEQGAKSYRRTLAELTGCIDFHWLESSGRETVKQARANGYCYKDGAHEFHLITRPWTRAEFSQILEVAKSLHEIPRRKRHQLNTILRYGAELSNLAFTRWRRSLLAPELKVLKRALEALPDRLRPYPLEKGAYSPWFFDSEDGVYKSILPELAELAEITEMIDPE